MKRWEWDSELEVLIESDHGALVDAEIAQELYFTLVDILINGINKRTIERVKKAIEQADNQ